MEAGRESAVVVGVDTGGTFTDVFASDGRVVKLRSTPTEPARAILEGLRTLGVHPGDAVGHGSTIATNAVLERRGAPTALVTTAGFEDVLALRRQNRPKLYDLLARWPDPLVPEDRRLGVHERLDYRGEPLQPLTDDEIERVCRDLRETGAESVAVCLLFSYVDPDHERRIAAALGPDFSISLSSAVAPQSGEYERTSTTVINAYVGPAMLGYLTDLNERLGHLGIEGLQVMLSGGGLADVETAANRPVSTVLSGPAAGVVGAKHLAGIAGIERIITLDIGGTSTDVALVSGEIEEADGGEIGGFPLLVPMLLIETIGAGGGSIARVDAAGGLHVGPQSAGADPGPAAYGLGEDATVTDANLVLGRLSAEGLLGGELLLDVERARDAVARIGRQLGVGVEQAAWGIVRLATISMDRAIRTVSLQRGHDPRRFALFPFGGAGPLHAAEVAESLGIREVVVPPHPGVMAALGLTVPDLRRDFKRTVLLPLDQSGVVEAQRSFAGMRREADDERASHPLFGPPGYEEFAFMRYTGQSFDLKVQFSTDVDELRARFTEAYMQRYGTPGPGGPVQIAHLGLRVTSPRVDPPALVPPWPEGGRPAGARCVWFGSGAGLAGLSAVEAPVLWRPALPPGSEISGPAVIEQYDSTTIVPPGWVAGVDDRFNLVVRR